MTEFFLTQIGYKAYSIATGWLQILFKGRMNTGTYWIWIFRRIYSKGNVRLFFTGMG